MSDQAHCLVRVAIEGQLDQADDLLSGLIEQVLLRILCMLIQKLQLGDFTTVSRAQSRPS